MGILQGFIISFLALHGSDGAFIQLPDQAVGWWPAEGNALDNVNGNDGLLVSGATFAPGKVGTAFSFDGVDDAVSFGNTVGNFGSNDFTVEFWVQTTNNALLQSLLSKRTTCGNTSLIDIRVGDGASGVDGIVTAAMVQNADGANRNILHSSTRINDGAFHHVALVRQKTNAFVYVDGVLEDSNSTTSVTFISNTANLVAGRSACTDSDGTRYFRGALDELTLYQRSLTQLEVSRIYSAGSAGKYYPNIPGCPAPTIISHPVDTLAEAGGRAMLVVDALDAGPLRYQWLKDGSPVPGATNTHLELAPVRFSDAGVYTAVVSNDCRSRSSLSALLAVNHPPVADAAKTMTWIVSPNRRSAVVVLDATQSHDPDGGPLNYEWFNASGSRFGTDFVTTATLPLGTTQVKLVVSDGRSIDTTQVAVEVFTPRQAIQRMLSEVDACPLDPAHEVLFKAPLLLAEHWSTQDNLMAGVIQLRLFQRRVYDLMEDDNPDLAARWKTHALAVIHGMKSQWADSMSLENVLEEVQASALPDPMKVALAARLRAVAGGESNAIQEKDAPQSASVQDAGSGFSIGDLELRDVYLEGLQALIDADAAPSGHHLAIEPSGAVNFEFDGREAETYIIEVSPDKVNWDVLGVATPAGERRYTYHDPQGAMHPFRYYRAVTP